MLLLNALLLHTLLLSPPSFASSDFLDFDPSLQSAAQERWGQAGFKNTQIRVIAPSTHFEIKAPLNLLVLNEPEWNNSSWSIEEVISELRIAEEIYSECKVSFGPITVIQTESGQNTFGLGTDYNFELDKQLLNPALLSTRPTVIFKRDGGSYSWHIGTIARYFTPYGSTGEGILLGNVSVSYALLKQTQQNPSPHKDYSILAHELAHAFWNTGHIEAEDGNILNGTWETKGRLINGDQCKALRERLKK